MTNNTDMALGAPNAEKTSGLYGANALLRHARNLAECVPGTCSKIYATGTDLRVVQRLGF